MVVRCRYPFRRCIRAIDALSLLLLLPSLVHAGDDAGGVSLRGASVGVGVGGSGDDDGSSGSSPRQLVSDGTCSNYNLDFGQDGWHSGTYGPALSATSSPNGINWTWEQCAAECCSRSISQCSFWTLRLNGDGACLMMTDKGSYSDTGGHIEGDRDEDCCSPNPPSGGAWEFVWSDEFDGDGDNDDQPLDPNTWGYEIGFVRNNEAQYYTDRLENSRIDGNSGHALIEARQDYWNGREYTSASRTTKGKKSFLYGRFSLRARIDVRAGSWPAWWWLPDTGGWPQGGEIDMMEYYQNKLLFNVMDGYKRWSSVQPSLDTFVGGGEEFARHFHTWTFDWSPDKIRLYLDGVLMNDYDVSSADGTGPDGENPFRRPGYLLMNQAIGGTAGGNPSGTDFPVQYRVDWVRQWMWNETRTDGVVVTVEDGAGSGTYAPGTKATAAAGQPPVVGQVFGSWTVVASEGDGVTLDHPGEETTTFTVPGSGGGDDVVIRANFVAGNTPTDAPVTGPTPPPIDPMDGVCSKYATTGWHQGTYQKVMQPSEAPGGSWDWEECARECALYSPCQFWTVQLSGSGECLLMSNQGDYIDTHSHAEGDRDLDCASDGTAPPTTASPTGVPTTTSTPPPPTPQCIGRRDQDAPTCIESTPCCSGTGNCQASGRWAGTCK